MEPASCLLRRVSRKWSHLSDFFHELHAGVDTVQMVFKGVYQVRGECCARVIQASPPKLCVLVWKVDSASCSRSSKTRFAITTDTLLC